MKPLSYRLKIGAALFACVGAMALAAGGCELIASVDRSLIPTPGGTGGAGGMKTTSSTTSVGGGGMGGMPMCTPANQAQTCPTTTCAPNSCVNGKCMPAIAAKGTACTDNNGVVCDGMGKCVAMHCTDMIKDADETDVDCGGKDCSACALGKVCAVNKDCANGSCKAAPMGMGGMGGSGGKGGAGGAGPAGKTCQACTGDGDCTADASTMNTWCCSDPTVCAFDMNVKGAATAACEKPQSNAPPFKCTEAAECASKNCVDGFCCDTACSGACDACSKALGADTDGVCKPMSVKNTDATKDFQRAGTCDDTKGGCGGKCACDASASCKEKLGQTQADKTKCASNFSEDGVCCNSACEDAANGSKCSACSNALNGGAGDGKCTTIKNGTVMGKCDASTAALSAPDACANTPCICGSNGTCLGDLGSKEASNTNCNSNFLADGVCCNTACSGKCDACTQTLGAVKDGTCSAMAVKSTVNPNICDATNGMCNGADKCTCDANGNCKAQQGQTCAADGDCATGHCVDTVCCNTACTGACNACKMTLGASADGTCTAVMSKVVSGKCDAATKAGVCESTPCTCDATSTCKGDVGSSCAGAATDCAVANSCFDKFCCNSTTCNGICQGCAMTLTGAANGTCAPYSKNGTETGKCDASTAICGAMGTSKPCACDGAGTGATHCLGASTAPCDAGKNAECVNGTCTAMTNVCN